MKTDCTSGLGIEHEQLEEEEKEEKEAKEEKEEKEKRKKRRSRRRRRRRRRKRGGEKDRETSVQIDKTIFSIKKLLIKVIVKCVCVCVCVFSNANPLHYYALLVPRRADRWR